MKSQFPIIFTCYYQPMFGCYINYLLAHQSQNSILVNFDTQLSFTRCYTTMIFSISFFTNKEVLHLSLIMYDEWVLFWAFFKKLCSFLFSIFGPLFVYKLCWTWIILLSTADQQIIVRACLLVTNSGNIYFSSISIFLNLLSKIHSIPLIFNAWEMLPLHILNETYNLFEQHFRSALES